MIWYWLTSNCDSCVWAHRFVHVWKGALAAEERQLVLQWIWKHLETGLRMLQTLSDFLPQNCIHLASNCKLYSSYSSWHSGIHETAMPLAENEPCSEGIVALELPLYAPSTSFGRFMNTLQNSSRSKTASDTHSRCLESGFRRGVFPDLQQIHESSLQLPSLHGGCCSRSSPSQS